MKICDKIVREDLKGLDLIYGRFSPFLYDNAIKKRKKQTKLLSQKNIFFIIY